MNLRTIFVKTKFEIAQIIKQRSLIGADTYLMIDDTVVPCP